MTDEQKENYLKDESKTVNNNFIIQDEDGFRIQSHYLGSGISVKNLKKQINYIVEEDIYKQYMEGKDKMNELTKKLEDINIKIEDIEKSYPQINIKE